MSAFIKLNKQDAIIAPYTTHKLWSISNTYFSEYGIDVLEAELTPPSSSVTTYPSLSYATYVLPNDGTFDQWDSNINEYPGGRYLLPGYLDIEYNQSTGIPIRGRIRELDNNNVDISSAITSWTDLRYRVGVSGPGVSIRSGSLTNIVQENGTYTFDIVGGSQDTYINLYSVTNPRHLDPTPVFSQTVTTSYGTLFNPSSYPTTGTTQAQYKQLVHRSLQHLYYSRFDEGAAISSSYFTYDQTTLYSSASRELNSTAVLISIPKEIYGQSIKPGTFRLTASEQNSGFLSASFVSGGFVERFITDGSSIYDDAEGVLRDANNNNVKVGDIIYTHGHAIITDTATASELLNQVTYTIAFRSSYTVFFHSYRCRVTDSQLNYSQNPTIKSGSEGFVYDFVTGSYFQPYVTTVGLYNDLNELVAVGKLGQPIPKTKYVDTTFVINFDI